MTHSPLPVLLHNRPILLPTTNSARLSKLDHDQERRRTSHTNKSSRNETILVPQIINPWRDTDIDILAFPGHITVLRQYMTHP